MTPQTSICLFSSAVLARFELRAALGPVMCVISMVFDGCRRISRTFLHSSLVLIVFSLSCLLFGEKWLPKGISREAMKKYFFKQKVLHYSCIRAKDPRTDFLFFALSRGDHQGAKRVKWLSEKSLSILENFFDSFRFSFRPLLVHRSSRILQCFLIYFMLLLFSG